jgi:hypothetical protein
MLAELLAFIKAAGAKSESDSDRDGFLSYHAESHAAGLGIAAGWFATATGETRLLSVVYGAAVYGKAQGTNEKRRRIVRDVVEEPQYALAGVVVGAAVGTVAGQLSINV